MNEQFGASKMLPLLRTVYAYEATVPFLQPSREAVLD